MSDPRITPDPALVTVGEPAQIGVPIVDLLRSPAGARDRQLLLGEAVTNLGGDATWRYVRAEKDGYCGHVPTPTLTAPVAPTHRVSAPATHAYTQADMKSPDQMSMSFGSLISVLDQTGQFARTVQGYIPLGHLTQVDEVSDDPVEVAELLLGTPYLWGGNSCWGIDCSGLVQAALLACGIPCPGDSDLQQSLGAEASDGYRRNDLLFWKGHVALVCDAETLIHANAASMSTRKEGIAEAIRRIQATGDGPVTAHRRLL